MAAATVSVANGLTISTDDTRVTVSRVLKAVLRICPQLRGRTCTRLVLFASTATVNRNTYSTYLGEQRGHAVSFFLLVANVWARAAEDRECSPWPETDSTSIAKHPERGLYPLTRIVGSLSRAVFFMFDALCVDKMQRVGDGVLYVIVSLKTVIYDEFIRGAPCRIRSA